MKQQNKRKRRERRTPETIFLVNRQAEVISISVDDPYFNRAYGETSSNTQKIQALMNARESPALWMFIHNNIDSAQFEAAKQFRRLYEKAQGTGIQSQDFLKEPVDGGKFVDSLTDERMDAAKELIDVRKKLGHAGYLLVEQVCGHCIDIAQLYNTDWARRRERRNFKNCLETLTYYWGYQTRKGHFYRDAKDARRAV